MNAPAFRRKEDNRLVRGRGHFVDDETGRVLHLKLVRSPYAHARIVSIDMSEAESLDGVVCTLTGAEVAKLTNPFMQIAPSPADQIRDFCMAPERARFQGEPVAAVLATMPAIAADAVELVRVDYEPLPVIVDAVQALKNENSPSRADRDKSELGLSVRMGRSRSGVCRSRHDDRNRSAQIPSLFQHAA